jgi:hypothetical protein
MTRDAFKVGQIVRVRGTAHNLPRGSYRVLRVLPATAGGVALYCIKSEAEMIERVVEQHDIEAA